jgi:hypothetical protein
MGNTPSRRQQQQQPLPPGYQAAPVFPGGPQVRLRWRGVTIPARCRPGSQPEPTAALAVHQRPVLRGLHRRAVWPVPGAVPRPAGAGERHARCEHRPPPSRRPQPTSPRAQAPPIPQQFGGPRPVPTQEYQKTATVKNPVNLKKHTISLTPLPDQPHILSVSFTFDADEPCRSAQVAESCPLAAPRAGRGGGCHFHGFNRSLCSCHGLWGPHLHTGPGVPTPPATRPLPVHLPLPAPNRSKPLETAPNPQDQHVCDVQGGQEDGVQADSQLAGCAAAGDLRRGGEPPPAQLAASCQGSPTQPTAPAHWALGPGPQPQLLPPTLPPAPCPPPRSSTSSSPLQTRRRSPTPWTSAASRTSSGWASSRRRTRWSSA